MRLFLLLVFILFAMPASAQQADPLSVYAPRNISHEPIKKSQGAHRSGMPKYQILQPTRFSHYNKKQQRNFPPLPAHKPMQVTGEPLQPKTVRRAIPSSNMAVDTTNLERDLKPLNAQQVLESISNRKIEQ